MGSCSLCKNDFPLLSDDANSCGKCLARKPGLSAAEIALVNVCYKFFNLSLSLLTLSIRTSPSVLHVGSCHHFWRIPYAIGVQKLTVNFNFSKSFMCRMLMMWAGQGRDVPMYLLKMKGVSQLLFPPAERDDHGDLAASILQSAATHQLRASDSRLGLGPPKTTVGSSSRGTSFRSLSEASAYLHEKKAKKAEFKIKETGLKISATLWKSEGAAGKLKQVSSCCRNCHILDLRHFFLDCSDSGFHRTRAFSVNKDHPWWPS